MTMHRSPRALRSGSFTLGLCPEEAFSLFTAEGEREWVPGWSPTLLGPAEQEPGLVFLTGEGREFTVWTVLESDVDALRHRYSRVTPAIRAGTVEVRLVGEAGGCRVHVRYDLTALPGGGDEALEGYSPSNFEAMLGEWQSLIEACLNRRSLDAA